MKIKTAARYLVDARTSAQLRQTLPPDLMPGSVEEAYAVQDEIITLSGGAGGWKIAPRPNGGEFLCSPIPQRFFLAPEIRIGRPDLLSPEAEAEIAIRMGQDLGPKPGGYSLEEVMAAVASLHPVIEILSSRFENRKSVDPLCNLADLQSCGAVVVGPPCADWRTIEMSNVALAMSVDGREVGSTAGGAASHHVFAALAWLANHANGRNGGLRKGDVVITGSRVGPVQVAAGAQVTATAGVLGTLRTIV
jgi:2-keto-4-pentenoate hydratase